MCRLTYRAWFQSSLCACVVHACVCVYVQSFHDIHSPSVTRTAGQYFENQRERERERKRAAHSPVSASV